MALYAPVIVLLLAHTATRSPLHREGPTIREGPSMIELVERRGSSYLPKAYGRYQRSQSVRDSLKW